MSSDGKKCIFVSYDYTKNAILVRARKDRKSQKILEASEDLFTYLKVSNSDKRKSCDK